MKRIGMMNIKEILQHRHELGLTRAQTATAVGVSTGTVSHIPRAGRRRRGLSWPLPDGLDDEALRARPVSERGARCRVRAARLGGGARGAGPQAQAPADAGDAAPALGRVPRRSSGAGPGLPTATAASAPCSPNALDGEGRKAQMRFDYEPGLWGLSDFSGQDAGVAHRARRDRCRGLRRGAGPLADDLCRGGARPERASLDDGAPAGSGVLRRCPLTLDHRQPQGRRRQGGPRGAPAQPELPRVRAALQRRRAAGTLGKGHGQGARGIGGRRGSRRASCWRCATRPSSRSTR